MRGQLLEFFFLEADGISLDLPALFYLLWHLDTYKSKFLYVALTVRKKMWEFQFYGWRQHRNNKRKSVVFP